MEKGALIGQGRTADVYAWGQDSILKLYHERFPGHSVEQEYRLSQSAQAMGMPVPAARQLIEVDGRYGIIFERLEGPSMLKVLAAQPWRMVAVAHELAILHSTVHGSNQLPDAMPAQRDQIKYAIESAKDLSSDEKDAALSRMAQLPDGHILCHGDFHPDNILLTARGPFVIDWMTGTRGNPLADVCRTSMIFKTSGPPPGSPLQLRLMAKVFSNVIQAIYINRYLQLRPGTRQDIDAWMLPLMAARLREVTNFPAERQLLLTRIRAALRG